MPCVLAAVSIFESFYLLDAKSQSHDMFLNFHCVCISVLSSKYTVSQKMWCPIFAIISSSFNQFWKLIALSSRISRAKALLNFYVSF